MSLFSNKQMIGIAVVGAGVAWYLKGKATKAASDLFSSDPNNMYYQGANELIGGENLATGADYVFGGIDLLNPWASEERKRYARSVYQSKE